jgi:hypothetical protein
MPGKRSRGPSTARQARYFGVLAGRGVRWAKDKLRGRKVGYRGSNIGRGKRGGRKKR